MCDVVPRHIIGIGIVIHVFGIFIGPDNIMNFQTTVNVNRAGNPEGRGFGKKCESFVAHESTVVSGLPVSHYRPGDIRHDMMFRQSRGHFLPDTGSNVDRRKFRRLFLPVAGAFPREQCTGPSITTCFFTRSG
ncbi:hypothetical protein D3C80_1060840 [compost metagenome]